MWMRILRMIPLLLVICLIVEVCSLHEPTTTKIEPKKRQKRWIPRFPYNSCYALAVVLAIPLDLKGRNVYMSYNFETNYYFPYFDTKQGIVPLPFATIDEDGVNLGTIVVASQSHRKLSDKASDVEEARTSTGSKDFTALNHTALDSLSESSTSNSQSKDKPKAHQLRRKSRQILDHLMSRRSFYKIIENKLNDYGVNGRACVLKTICSASDSPLGSHNGVLGDIVHIIFTPSTSEDERLTTDYRKAEQYGRNHGCQMYDKKCPISILDLISVYM